MLSSITDVASTIQTIEGYYPGSLSYRLNNPGNLIYAGQPGATPVTVGSHIWASFNSYDAGYQALVNQINLDASRGLTVQQFINKYAPASDGNNPNSYAVQVANSSGVGVNDSLSAALQGGTVVEQGSGVDMSSFDFSNVSGTGTGFDWATIGISVGVIVAAALLFRG